MPEVKFEWKQLPKPKPNKRGPKFGKQLRHEVKELFHQLLEKATLLNELDPSFKAELVRLELGRPMEKINRAIAIERGREV